MATNEVKEAKKQENTPEIVTETEKKGFMQVAEFRMLVYVVPVALVLLVLALLLGK